MKLRCYTKIQDRPNATTEVFRTVNRHGGRIVELDALQNGNGSGTLTCLVELPDAAADVFAAEWQARYPSCKPSMRIHNTRQSRHDVLPTHRIVIFATTKQPISHHILKKFGSVGINFHSIWWKVFVDQIGPLPEAEKLVAYAHLTERQVHTTGKILAKICHADPTNTLARLQPMSELTGQHLHIAARPQSHDDNPREPDRRDFDICAWNRAGLANEVVQLAHTHNCTIEQIDGMRRNHGTAAIMVRLNGPSHNLDAFWHDIERFPVREVPVTPYHAQLCHNLRRTEDASHLLTVSAAHASLLPDALHLVKKSLQLDISRLSYVAKCLHDGNHVVHAFFDEFNMSPARFHQIHNMVVHWANHHGCHAHFCLVQSHHGDTEVHSARPMQRRTAA